MIATSLLWQCQFTRSKDQKTSIRSEFQNSNPVSTAYDVMLSAGITSGK